MVGQEDASPGTTKRSSLQADSSTISFDEVGIATNLHITSRVLDTNSADSTTGSFGYITSLYKVVDSKDGICYTLRRVERARTNNDMIVGIQTKWIVFPHICGK